MERLRQQLSDWGIRLNGRKLSLLDRYADLLAGYELANVIGTRDREKIVLDHLMDSLSCFLAQELCQASSLVDVGTGAGLPGIPLGIVRPELSVTLLETTEKKARFLDYALRDLGLQNLQVLHDRAEEAARKPEYRGTFEFAVARALAALPVVLEYCAPLVSAEGTILAMKGQLTEEELSQGLIASRELGVELREVKEVTYSSRGLQKERRLVVLKKVGVTPERFPRRVGLAKKRPLGA